MSFENWLEAVRDHLVSHSAMTTDEAHAYVFDNRPDWKMYFDDSYAPADAADEDMSYWDAD